MKHFHASRPAPVAVIVATLMLGSAASAFAQQDEQEFPQLMETPVAVQDVRPDMIQSDRVRAAFQGVRIMETLDFSTDEVELENINAVVRVMPQDRQDVSIDFHKGPKPEFEVIGGKLVVDGGIEDSNGWGWNNDWCSRRDRKNERTVMTIRVPRQLDIAFDGAVDAAVGPSDGGDVAMFGCGHADVAPVNGDLNAKAGNSTSLRIVSIAGNASLHSMNSSDLKVDGPIGGDLSAKVMNSSDMELTSVAGNATIEDFNSADLELTTIGGDLTVKVYNSADLEIDAVAGSVIARIMNSGDLDLDRIGRDLDIEISNGAGAEVDTVGGSLEATLNNGSDLEIDALTAAASVDVTLNQGSTIEIANGAIGSLDLTMYQDSTFDFGGRVETADIHMYSDRDSYIAEVIDVRLRKDDRAGGEVRFGKITNLNQ
ncbi:DUF4097 domain-containing protein [Parvularcula flava]|uniref:DUF4097 domain-containing protein n=1 Tax=Aquisalinus luteolus TaxID=1566827 RepID=A0A8J3A3G9_9PROT|nr:DUF4097 family beta strand repeat-containing protein [Aquisalinus luteolus]NHK28756.1 DUF4097 domain-containing protein [Aquisalinus luteolus]GGH99425.1 hypothetical protein GCM10011355_25350 [Aquisalinus luteolus]